MPWRFHGSEKGNFHPILTRTQTQEIRTVVSMSAFSLPFGIGISLIRLLPIHRGGALCHFFIKYEPSMNKRQYQ